MSTPRLKYNPKAYKRIAEIYAWLADGKNVQVRATGRWASERGRNWANFRPDMGSVQWLLDENCEFRVKPFKLVCKETKGWIVE